METKEMDIKSKIKQKREELIQEGKIEAPKKKTSFSAYVGKICFAVVVVEFLLAGAFFWQSDVIVLVYDKLTQ